MLFAEEAVAATNPGYMSAIIVLGSALGGVITVLGKMVIEYRKAADSGQLALVQAEQQSIKEELGTVKKHAESCDEMHRKCELQCAELRGTVKALQIQIARDTSETIDLAERHGKNEERVRAVEAKLAENGK